METSPIHICRRPTIENDHVKHFDMLISKSKDSGGAWRALAISVDRTGHTVDVSADAFTNLAAAKRWCAAVVGRKSMSWPETSPGIYGVKITVKV